FLLTFQGQEGESVCWDIMRSYPRLIPIRCVSVPVSACPAGLTNAVLLSWLESWFSVWKLEMTENELKSPVRFLESS
ncbi:hypothetical protein XENOCAPTIV_024476, partial [Xenoophorus captivus]